MSVKGTRICVEARIKFPALRFDEQLSCLCKITRTACGTYDPDRYAKLPWQNVGVDLCQIDGADYLAVVDYFSRYPELARLTRTSGNVITHLRSIFARHGIPEVVFSDNGTQFVSAEFRCFSKDYGFQHVTSRPRYPQANGEVKRMVKTIKGLIKKFSDHYLASLDYRDTPVPLGKARQKCLWANDCVPRSLSILGSWYLRW